MAALALLEVHEYVLTQQRYVLMSFMRGANLAVVFDVHTGDIELRSTPTLPSESTPKGFPF